MNLFSKYIRFVAVSALLFVVNTGYGAPGKIEDLPLFLGFSVKSNILMIADDSGSMGWRYLQPLNGVSVESPSTYELSISYSETESCPEGYTPSGSSLDPYRGKCYKVQNSCPGGYPRTLNGTQYCYLPKIKGSSHSYINQPSNATLYGLCHAANPLAFNSSQTYTPWAGCGSSHSLFGKVSNCPSLVSYDQVKRNGFFEAVDQNSDGQLSGTECQIGAADVKWVKNLDAKGQLNYRNWYTYYLTRMDVSKKAMGEVVSSNDQRIGLSTIQQRQFSEVVDMVNAAGSDKARTDLLGNVYGLWAKNGTPLRASLHRAGQYFSHRTKGPILPKDKGGSCQQNFALLMTDGYWNGSLSTQYGNQTTGSNEFLRASDKDSKSNTLADVAFYYYKTDLDKDWPSSSQLPNNVPTRTGVDENNGQHMVTFGIALGVSGQLTASSTNADKDANPKDPDARFNWPDPDVTNDNPSDSDNRARIDDLRHAAWSSRGKFLSAQNPDELINSLKNAFEEIADRTGTAASATFNSSSLDSGSIIYHTSFSTSGWSGNLYAKGIDPDTGELKDAPIWSAAEELTKNRDSSDRQIITYNGSRGVPFKSGNLSAEQQADLTLAVEAGSNLDDVVSYLRGDRTHEGGLFRERNTSRGLLGDIVHSAPVYVKGAASNWPGFIEPGYFSYASSLNNRQAILYVGANDGMLHAFNADTGEEIMGYIPNGVYSSDSSKGLHALTSKNYDHRYYVDATPTVADAYVDSNWKTVLLSGLGAGGKSIFALDVTDPSKLTEASASSTVMWEYQSDNLGYSFGQPQVAKMNDGTWVAIVGNGYNSTSGTAQVLIIDLKTGSLIKALDTQVGSVSADASCDSCNGMSTASPVDLDGNGTVDYIYAGDMKGNVWVINTSSSKQSEWVFDSSVTYNDDGSVASYGGGLAKPMFTAKDGHAITTKLTVAPLYRQSKLRKNYPGVMVMFGTGQFVAEGDNIRADTEYFYGVQHSFGQNELNIDMSGRFKERTIATNNTRVKDANGDFISVRTISSKEGEQHVKYEEIPQKREHGWYVKLPSSGERVIHDPILVGDYVIFNTFILSNSDPCSYGAAGYLMAINYRNGLAPESLLDFNGDGVVDSQDKDLSGVYIDSPPAGISRMGNSGIGISEFEDPSLKKLNLFGNSPDRTSWTDIR